MVYGKRREGRDTLYTAIGEAILLARRRAGMNQAELGARLGISGAAVSDLERAATRPNLDDLAEIAAALGVPLHQLVVLPDERRLDPPSMPCRPGAKIGAQHVGQGGSDATVGRFQEG